MGEIDIPRKVQIDLWHADVRTQGRFAGVFLLAPGSNRMVAGVVSLTPRGHNRLAPPETIPVVIPHAIKAGPYLVAFFTDAPATIILPVKNQIRSATVTPQPPLDVTFAATNAQSVSGSPAGMATIPIRFGRNDFAVLGESEQALVQQAGYADECLVHPGDQDCVVHGEAGGDAAFFSPGATDAGMGQMVFLYQRMDRIPAGRYDAIFHMASVGVSTEMTAFVLDVDLPPTN